MRFWAVIAATYVVLAVICAVEPVLGDSWGHFVQSRTPLTWDGFVRSLEMAYSHGNPRWGQIPLALSFRAWWVATLISPLMIVGMLLAMMTLVRGRWPRPRDPADTWLFVCVLAAAMATAPQVGAMWFYRPICTNYIYPLAVQLLWLVPYRFLAARPPGTRLGSLVLALAIVPLGALAGAGNEHTGLVLAVAAIVCLVVAWRRDRRIPLWAVTGLSALIAGYVLLLTAPGQQVRYHGIAAAQQSILEPLFGRGLLGNLGALGLLLAWASPMGVVVGVAVRLGRWRPSPALRSQLLVYLALAALALGTTLLSPRLTPRLLLATSTIVALGLGAIMIDLEPNERATRWLRRACTGIAGVVLVASLVINIATGIEGRRRVEQLSHAAPGSVVHVVPYTFSLPTPFAWGDDLRNLSVRERTARKLGLEKILYGD